MDRRDVILKYITKEKQGIEIGPFHSPLTPKRDGYNCLVMDVFDLATLKKMAKENVGISDEQCELLEDVDLLGSSTHIDKVVDQHGKLGQFDYLVSSHNFEHLPNRSDFSRGVPKYSSRAACCRWPYPTAAHATTTSGPRRPSLHGLKRISPTAINPPSPRTSTRNGSARVTTITAYRTAASFVARRPPPSHRQ